MEHVQHQNAVAATRPKHATMPMSACITTVMLMVFALKQAYASQVSALSVRIPLATPLAALLVTLVTLLTPTHPFLSARGNASPI